MKTFEIDIEVVAIPGSTQSKQVETFRVRRQSNLISWLPQTTKIISNKASCTLFVTCAQGIIFNEEGNAPYQTP